MRKRVSITVLFAWISDVTSRTTTQMSVHVCVREDLQTAVEPVALAWLAAAEIPVFVCSCYNLLISVSFADLFEQSCLYYNVSCRYVGRSVQCVLWSHTWSSFEVQTRNHIVSINVCIPVALVSAQPHVSIVHIHSRFYWQIVCTVGVIVTMIV
jgi:hypothetical protein